jgi:ATP-dependent DNA ligase
MNNCSIGRFSSLTTTGFAHLPLSERLRDLGRLARKARLPGLKLVESFPYAAALLEHCNLTELEGIVSKRVDKPYPSGPSKHSLKIKCDSWSRRNQYRFKVFEEPAKPQGPSDRAHLTDAQS